MLLPCIWISEFNRIHQYITTRNIQWPVITSLCNANKSCFLWFPSMTDIPLRPPLAGSHRRKSENPHKRDICSSPQCYCWKKSCTSWKKYYPFIPLFTRFMYPRWCRISSINSISDGIWHLYNKHTLEKPQRARYKTSVRLIRWCPFRYLLRWGKRVTLLCQLRTQQGEPTKRRQNLEPWTLSN